MRKSFLLNYKIVLLKYVNIGFIETEIATVSYITYIFIRKYRFSIPVTFYRDWYT